MNLSRLTRKGLVSYVHGASTRKLVYETIGDRFRRSVEKVPNKTLYVFRHQNIRKTYQDAYKDARRLAAALIELGVGRGDRVGMWGPNYYEWVTCQMATSIAGFVQVNINPNYQTEEMRYALRKVGVKVVITPKSFKKSCYYGSLQELIPSMASAKEGFGGVKNEAFPDLRHVVMFGEKEDHRGVWRLEDLVAGVGSDAEAKLKELEEDVTPDDPVNIQYTSGTTGNPKAAVLTHHNLVNNELLYATRAALDKGEQIICGPLPLFHCSGCAMVVICSILHQQTAIFPEASFNALKTLEAVSEERCTFLVGTPTIFIDCLAALDKSKGLDLSSLYGAMIGGSPVPISLAKRLVDEFGMRNIVPCYGTTETSPVLCSGLLDTPPFERIKNSGAVMEHTEIKLVDSKGRAVPRGEIGELLARGYSVMRGYYNDEEKTKKEITEDKWYRTGDTARMAEDGTITIVGRVKDMIIRGGENIYPTEIEQFLFKLPGIADVQVIGVPDERMGEEVCAWIRLREGVCDVTPESVKEACKGKISHQKIPKFILIKKEHEFPLTPTGKVKKFVMREMSKKELGLEQVPSHFNE